MMKNSWTAATQVADEVRQSAIYLDRLLMLEHAPEPVGEIIAQVVKSAGKRMRPLLLFLTARLGPAYCDRQHQLCTAAALIELIHTASLVHDDIIDDSPLRRGSPTIQARFGKDMAVYTGDLLLSLVMEQAFEAELYQTGKVLANTIKRMCYGELCQKKAMFCTKATEQNYLAVIEGKTAALFEAACRCGAIEAQCTHEQCEQLAIFGSCLGFLFQMRDDLIDFCSEQAREGKPVHQDFLHGIFTLPVLRALTLPQTEGDMLQAIAYLKHDPAQAERMMRKAVAQADGIGYTKARMQCYYERANDILDHLAPDTQREGLQQILTLLMPQA